MIRAALAAMLAAGAAQAEPVLLHAAGSLRAALTEVAADCGAAEGVEVVTAFTPSGPLRERIEGGETAHFFVSASMGHPRRLAEADPTALSFRRAATSMPG